MGSTRPNPMGYVGSGRVGLDLCDELSWVEFF